MVAVLSVFALMVAAVPQKVEAAAKKSTGSSSTAKKTSTSKKASAAKKSKKKSNPASKTDAEAKKLVAKLTPTQKKNLLTLLNKGDVEELSAITDVGETRAKTISKARPFKSVEAVREVNGIGKNVFANIVAYGKKPKSANAKKSSAKKKTSSKAKK